MDGFTTSTTTITTIITTTTTTATTTTTTTTTTTATTHGRPQGGAWGHLPPPPHLENLKFEKNLSSTPNIMTFDQSCVFYLKNC